MASECDQVVTGEQSSFLGVDNVVLGFLFYVAVATLALTSTFVSPAKKRGTERTKLILTGIGFLFSLYLIYVQIKLDSFCVLCLTSAGLVTSLFGLQVLAIPKKTASQGDAKPMAIVGELGLFSVFSFVAIGLLIADIFFINQIGTSILGKSQDQQIRAVANSVLEERIDLQYLNAMAPCSYDNEVAPISDFQTLIKADDPYLGNPDAEITVIELFDPNCPHCKRLHPLLRNVVAKYGDRVKFYFKPFPLWQYSIKQIEAIWLAAEQNQFFEMIDLQFQAQQKHGLPMQKLLALADTLGLDTRQFADGLKNNRLQNEVFNFTELVNSRGIHSAPKILINGKIVGRRGQTITETCIGRLLEQEIRTATSGHSSK
ncbi:MAG: thioredoxin domain-containing protein [bacterium]